MKHDSSKFKPLAHLDFYKRPFPACLNRFRTSILVHLVLSPLGDMVKFNREYIDSIILNLITNSIKYARPEVYPTIHFSTKSTERTLRLSVKDNGQGMDMEKVGSRIFKLNQSFHGNSDSKGVGLYLVYHHVTSLGGKIEVESEVNKGTTFTISFP